MSTDKKANRVRFHRWGVVLLAVSSAVVSLLIIALTTVSCLNAVTEEDKQPPAFLLMSSEPLINAAGEPVPSLRPRGVPWNKSQPSINYNDYIRYQLEKNAADRGAALYAELDAQMRDQRWIAEYLRLFEDRGRMWMPGSLLTPEQLQWLGENRDFIGKLRRLIALGGPPMLARDEMLRQTSAKDGPTTPHYIFWLYSARILCAEAQRLRVAGDAEGAVGILNDVFSLGEMIRDQGLVGYLICMSVFAKAGDELASCLESSATLPAPIVRRLVKAIDDHMIPYREQTWNMRVELSRNREVAVFWFSTSAFVRMFYLSKVGMIPNPHERTQGVKDKFKDLADSHSRLKEFDSLSRQLIESYQAPYATFKQRDINAKFRRWNVVHLFGEPPKYLEYTTRACNGEARMNLNRTALRLLLKEAPGGLPAPETKEWLRSPWRDPFTEKPLKIVEEKGATDAKDAATTQTLIYSLGPDLVDQQGGLAYDPSNGTISAGDLFLKMTRRGE